MANLNRVLLMGNITRDPELKYLPSQTAVCEFGLAINRTWNGQDGVKKEETTFVDCASFGKAAEVLAQYKKKGDPLFVEGRLKMDQWEAKDGSKRSKIRVIVENFQFLNRSQGNGGNGEGGSAAGQTRTNSPQQQVTKAKAPPPQQGYQGEDGAPPLSDEDIPF